MVRRMSATHNTAVGRITVRSTAGRGHQPPGVELGQEHRTVLCAHPRPVRPRVNLLDRAAEAVGRQGLFARLSIGGGEVLAGAWGEQRTRCLGVPTSCRVKKPRGGRRHSLLSGLRCATHQHGYAHHRSTPEPRARPHTTGVASHRRRQTRYRSRTIAAVTPTATPVTRSDGQCTPVLRKSAPGSPTRRLRARSVRGHHR